VTMIRGGALACSMAFAVDVCGCQGHSIEVSPLVVTSSGRAPSLEDRIARELLEASPPADPADASARDAAGERLSRLHDLLDAAGERILWGGFDPASGYEPKANPVTEFTPVVWAKLYLSTFTFAGPYEVRREGRFAVLEIAARFRAGLDAGDYPYPFWHSTRKWQEYVDTATRCRHPTRQPGAAPVSTTTVCATSSSSSQKSSSARRTPRWRSRDCDPNPRPGER